MIGWVTFIRGDTPSHDEACYGSQVIHQSQIDQWIVRDTQICMIELLAAVVALDHHAARMRGRQLLLLVDSEDIESALVKGYSNRTDRGDLITIFWDIALRHDLNVYVARVPTDSNPADGPSRRETRELEVRGAERLRVDPSPYIMDHRLWEKELDRRDQEARGSVK